MFFIKLLDYGFKAVMTTLLSVIGFGLLILLLVFCGWLGGP